MNLKEIKNKNIELVEAVQEAFKNYNEFTSKYIGNLMTAVSYHNMLIEKDSLQAIHPVIQLDQETGVLSIENWAEVILKDVKEGEQEKYIFYEDNYEDTVNKVDELTSQVLMSTARKRQDEKNQAEFDKQEAERIHQHEETLKVGQPEAPIVDTPFESI